ncbi:MAG: pyridoxamine 5'-phosphate oxidase family protein [Chromatiales bacterium]|nr:pyridoxamine 5'-phosphate oxidase family protein [Chromatiales bacterium]
MNDTDTLIHSARNLLSGTFHGILASHSEEMLGYPFGSLAPYSIAEDGWPLFLMSHLAKHTKNIDAAPQCSLTIIDQGPGDVQTQMRLTCLGDLLPAEWITQEAIERHFRYFPQSRDYYEQLNFRFYHLTPKRFYCVGGFGAARWLGVDRLTHPLPFQADQEIALIHALMQEHSGLLNRWLAQHQLSPTPTSPASIIGIDSLGLDIRCADELLRLPFIEPVAQAAKLNEAVIEALTHPDDNSTVF